MGVFFFIRYYLFLFLPSPYAWLAESKRLDYARLAEWVCRVGRVRLHGWQSLRWRRIRHASVCGGSSGLRRIRNKFGKGTAGKTAKAKWHRLARVVHIPQLFGFIPGFF